MTSNKPTDRPPPYKRGAFWELLTGVDPKDTVIAEITLRHVNGTRVLLCNTPKMAWVLMESKLHLSSAVSIEELNLVSLGYEVKFLGQREDYLLIVCNWKKR